MSRNGYCPTIDATSQSELAPPAGRRVHWRHYFPLRNHFEQNFHVPHRLARYGAGVRLDYATTDPETLTHAVADALDRPITYRDVETDGARRAARMIAPLLDGDRR
jgi:hypothetical protein